MSIGTLRHALDLAGPDATLELSGGEPLLAKHLVHEVLDHLERRPGAACRLLTNGLGLDEAMLDRLVEADVELQVSCDGPVGQDERGPGTLPVLERLFATIRRRHPRYWRRRVAVATTFTPRTVACLAGAVAWLLRRGVATLTIAPACGPLESWGAAACRQLVRQLRAITAQSLAWRERTGAMPLTNLRERPPATAGVACGAALPDRLTIGPDGSMHRCALLALAASLPVAADLLADRARWTGGGRSCAVCPDLPECRACPMSGPACGVIPDAHCLFQRWSARSRRRLAADDPLGRLLAAAGLDEAGRRWLAGRLRGPL